MQLSHEMYKQIISKLMCIVRWGFNKFQTVTPALQMLLFSVCELLHCSTSKVLNLVVFKTYVNTDDGHFNGIGNYKLPLIFKEMR